MTSSVLRIALLLALAMAVSVAATWTKAYLASTSQSAQSAQPLPDRHQASGHG